jgi:hypothetical protein
MLFIWVGIGFLLLFAVLISDGISSGSAATSDVSSRTRKSDSDAAAAPSETTSAVDGFRTIGGRRPDDGIDLAA